MPETEETETETETQESKEQDEALDAIIKYRNTYLEIDKKFKTEIDANIEAARRGCGVCRWLKT